jgi:hypothetical protein
VIARVRHVPFSCTYHFAHHCARNYAYTEMGMFGGFAA